MLATDVGDEICWRQFWDVSDGFGRFGHQHPLSFSISVGHQHPKDVISIKTLSTTPENCHQHKVTNIYVVLLGVLTVSMTAKILSTRSSGFVEISSWKFSECSTSEKTDETIWVISFFVMDPLLSKIPIYRLRWWCNGLYQYHKA